jgi:hypothetical protein
MYTVEFTTKGLGCIETITVSSYKKALETISFFKSCKGDADHRIFLHDTKNKLVFEVK